MASVLVVDDVISTRRVIEQAIARMGHTVIGTGSPAEAEELVKQLRPDLVLLDLFMPFMDGIAFLNDLRAKFGEHCPRTLFVSGAPQELFMSQMPRLTPMGYLSKPFHLHDLWHAVNVALSGA